MNASSTTTLPTLVEDNEHGLPTPEAGILDAIFTIAVAHDSKCQRAEHDLEWQAARLDDSEFEEFETTYRWAIIGLCATIATASLKRVVTLHPLAQKIVDNGLLVELDGEPLEEFLRPIFEESGIGDRFEVRQSSEVFKAAPGE